MSLYLLAREWMNGGKRMDENKLFPQLYYAALEYCPIVHNAIYSKHTWSGDISSLPLNVCLLNNLK